MEQDINNNNSEKKEENEEKHLRLPPPKGRALRSVSLEADIAAYAKLQKGKITKEELLGKPPVVESPPKSESESPTKVDPKKQPKTPEEKPVDANFVQLARAMIKSQNTEDIKAFLLTYRRFATPTQLYEIWVSFYTQLQLGHKSRRTKELLEASLNFLQTWISTYVAIDFNKKRASEILELIKNMDAQVQNQMKLYLLKGEELYKRSSSTAHLYHLPTTKSSRQSKDKIINIPSIEIAKALTMSEYELFQAVFPTEFLHKIGWQASEKDKEAVNIQRIISRFNEVSFWVSTEILSCNGRDQRNIVEKFIDIAKKCEKLNNFNSLMEIVSGMNNAAVQRLKRLWVSLPEKYIEQFEELEELMMPQNNFKNYYTELSKRTQPVLPYFALFLRDFTFINQGNNPTMDDGKINLDMIRMLGRRITFIQKYQAIPYRLSVDKTAMSYLSNLHYIDNDEKLYELSLACQPNIILSSSTMDQFMDTKPTTKDPKPTPEEPPTIIPIHSDYFSDTDEEDLSETSSATTDNKEKSLDSDNESSSKEDETPRRKSSDTTRSPIGGNFRKPRSRKRMKRMLQCQTVHIPEDLLPIFARSERFIDSQYGMCEQNLELGTISIHSERMLLLSLDFSYTCDILQEDEFSKKFLFDIGYLSGKSDGRHYKHVLGPKPYLSLISILAPQMSYSGRGVLEIFPEISISADDNFKLHFDLKNSCEISSSRNFPICFSNAGYISGFCSECIGIPLIAAEIFCKARGDKCCKFIVATTNKIDEMLLQFTHDLKLTKEQRQVISVSNFLDSLHFPRYLVDLPYEEGGTKIGGKKVVAVPNKLYKSNREQLNIESKVMRQSMQLFKELVNDPVNGKMFYRPRENHRYVMVRCKSITSEVYSYLKGVLPADQESIAHTFANHFVWDFGKMLGKGDYSRFELYEESQKTEKLYALVMVLQQLGWGKMEISLGFVTTPEDFYLKYTMHFSAEAESHLSFQKERGVPVRSPSCILNSGYCSEWLSNVYGIKLVCVEVCCKAAGHNCTFIVSTPEKIEEHVSAFLTETGRLEELSLLPTLNLHRSSEVEKLQDEEGRATHANNNVFSRIFGRKKN